ncbi:MAG TPA: hypothetical protein VKM54_10050 [Myxococcota bacterium]|nr:hypothetical protein [Myxococcota bacterium]
MARGVAVLMLAVGAADAASDVASAAECAEPLDVRLWWSPRLPTADLRLRFVAVADRQPISELVAVDPAGRVMPLEVVERGGPPWSLVATIERPASGNWRVEARRGDSLVACRRLEVASPGRLRQQGPSESALKEARPAWDRASEALYSTWIEHLFDAPPEASLAFPSLEPVLRDPTRNLLHNYLGLEEDDPGPKALRATPDCADLPYFLRAYFAWKLGLPFGFRACSRGSSSVPPRCGPPATNEELMQRRDALDAFKVFSRRVVDVVQSGNARTALDDDATDFYPVPLKRDMLRPGTIYADPYGHTLMIVRWVPQTPEHSGLLLAVDAQPDASVGRKRFWEGTFLFASQLPSAGPGFKAFRPLVHGYKTSARTKDGSSRLRSLSNRELAADSWFVPYSNDQAKLSPDEFYAHMAKLINPNGVDPIRAYEDTLDALVEQLETRVGSVDNGERYMRENGRVTISMPEGSGIFETTGLWEDYSTPSRDMRLLIAVKVLTDLPERVVRHPELFVLGSHRPEDARADLERLHVRRVSERAITYTRSDGSPWRLTVAEILARRPAFEMAYNPNDCVELRWGAAEDTSEYATCHRHAPREQRVRMGEYRIWFREARRPSR